MSPTIEPLLSPGAFTGLDGVTHLCTGGESPWLVQHDQVYAEFARRKSAGGEGRKRIYSEGEACRQKLATLWGVPAQRIAFMPSAAESMSWLARGLDWREGDNVVVPDLEFPSVAYAWRQLRERGVELRLVPHRDYSIDERDLVEAVDARTRVLAVSHVSFYTGQCLDLQQLADAIRGRGVLLAVDATHASGVLPVPAELADLCVSSCYKWMLATHGVAPTYLSEAAEERVRETAFGWRNLDVWPAQSAERLPEVNVQPMPLKLEPGNPAMVVVQFLSGALDVLLDIGIDRIRDHVRDLSELVRDGLGRRGYTTLAPTSRPTLSGNTSFLHDNPETLVAELARRGVLLWGEAGRVRVSCHLYNGSDDVDRLIKCLP